ncbi:MAG: hypothetical protein WCF16_06695 [Alphaproteobacteria bacterium]
MRAEVRKILEHVGSIRPLYQATRDQLNDCLDRLEGANATIRDLLRDYDTSDATTAKFWASSGITIVGVLAAPPTGGLSLIIVALGGASAAWCGWDLGRDIINGQIDLGLLEEIALLIDAIEAELIRRGH